MKLRDYQLQTVVAWERHRADRPIVVLPTGGGKTVTAAEIIRRHRRLAPGSSQVVVAPRREIIRQTQRALAAHGIEAGIILGRDTSGEALSVQVASPDTLARRELPEHIRLLVIDECHYAPRKTRKLLERVGAGVDVVGLTATPLRLDGLGLGRFGFGRIVVGATVEQLLELEHLVLPSIYSHPTPELGQIRRRAGDFASDELAETMGDAQVLGDVVEHWRRLTPNTRTIGFAVNIRHSEQLVAAFQAAGVAAEHIDGSTPTRQRDQVLERLADGRTLVVVNVDLIGMGWDLPELQTGLLVRPTQSLALYLQQVGRLMRPPGPVTCLDFAGNYIRHGSPLESIEYSLEGRPERPLMLSTRTCLECYAVFPATRSACPACGAAPETRDVVDIRHEPGELVPVIPFPERCEWWQRHRDAAAYEAQFGAPPLLAGGRWLANPKGSKAHRDAIFDRLLALYEEYSTDTGRACHEYRRIFRKWPRSVTAAKWMERQRGAPRREYSRGDEPWR